jgi:hypothetical protein
MRAVLDLDPFAAAPRPIAAIASLGDDPLEPHDTGLPEDGRAVRVRDVLRQADAVVATIQKLGQQGASRVPALRAQITAVELPTPIEPEAERYLGVSGDDSPGSAGGRMLPSAPINSDVKAAGGRMPPSASVSVSCFGT